MTTHGGKREGAGNKAGSKRKNTIVAQELFQKDAPYCAKFLKSVVINKKEPTGERIKAAKEILDRALGKAPQAVAAKIDEDITIIVTDDWS